MAGDRVDTFLSVDEYLSFFLTTSVAFGLVFELPLVLIFLSLVGVVSNAGLRRARPYAIVRDLRRGRHHHPDHRRGHAAAHGRSDGAVLRALDPGRVVDRAPTAATVSRRVSAARPRRPHASPTRSQSIQLQLAGREAVRRRCRSSSRRSLALALGLAGRTRHRPDRRRRGAGRGHRARGPAARRSTPTRSGPRARGDLAGDQPPSSQALRIDGTTRTAVAHPHVDGWLDAYDTVLRRIVGVEVPPTVRPGAAPVRRRRDPVPGRGRAASPRPPRSTTRRTRRDLHLRGGPAADPGRAADPDRPGRDHRPARRR